MADKHFIVNCEVYPFDVFVYFGSGKGFVEKFKQINPNHADMVDDFKFSLGKSVMFPDGTSAIWVSKKPKTAKSKAILSHEIFHCACFIMRRIGVKLGDKSEESFAYLIEYLTRKIYENLE